MVLIIQAIKLELRKKNYDMGLDPSDPPHPLGYAHDKTRDFINSSVGSEGGLKSNFFYEPNFNTDPSKHLTNR